ILLAVGGHHGNDLALDVDLDDLPLHLLVVGQEDACDQQQTDQNYHSVTEHGPTPSKHRCWFSPDPISGGASPAHRSGPVACGPSEGRAPPFTPGATVNRKCLALVRWSYRPARNYPFPFGFSIRTRVSCWSSSLPKCTSTGVSSRVRLAMPASKTMFFLSPM